MLPRTAVRSKVSRRMAADIGCKSIYESGLAKIFSTQFGMYDRWVSYRLYIWVLLFLILQYIQCYFRLWRLGCKYDVICCCRR